jgi:hypothetical protein
LHLTAQQEETDHGQNDCPVAVSRFSTPNGANKEKVQRIEKENLQISASGRMFGKKHHEEQATGKPHDEHQCRIEQEQAPTTEASVPEQEITQTTEAPVDETQAQDAAAPLETEHDAQETTAPEQGTEQPLSPSVPEQQTEYAAPFETEPQDGNAVLPSFE